MEKILPCPFCGGKSRLIAETKKLFFMEKPQIFYFVRCGKCMAQGARFVWGTAPYKNAVRRWNKRYLIKHIPDDGTRIGELR